MFTPRQTFVHTPPQFQIPRNNPGAAPCLGAGQGRLAKHRIGYNLPDTRQIECEPPLGDTKCGNRWREKQRWAGRPLLQANNKSSEVIDSLLPVTF